MGTQGQNGTMRAGLSTFKESTFKEGAATLEAYAPPNINNDTIKENGMATVGEVPLSNANEKSELASELKNQVKDGETESQYQQKAFQNEN